MIVLDNDNLAYAACEVLSLNYLQDYMNADFTILSRSLHLIMTIIQQSDIQLYSFLKEASMEPFFATSWLITWFSHDIKSIDQVSRLFDVLLSSPPIYIYYLSAAVSHPMSMMMMMMMMDYIDDDCNDNDDC